MNIEELFNQIIKEAEIGNVNCYFTFNTIFGTTIEGKQITTPNNENDLLIPNLNINNKTKFLELLTIYVNKSLKFYENDQILNDISELSTKIKTIITLLFSNATIEDFNNPIPFLINRINFFDKPLEDETFLSEQLNCLISIKCEKSSIVNETPYNLKISLVNNDEEYILPRVYFGINENSYIYAIQNDKNINQNNFSKKMNRRLYSLNSGLEDEELKDVTMSFILSANIALSKLKEYKKVTIPSILITRWNAKEMYYKKTNKDGSEHDLIQTNLTDKLIRTFNRLMYHHNGIILTSYPSEVDTSLHFEMNENDICNNPILDETYNRKNKIK